MILSQDPCGNLADVASDCPRFGILFVAEQGFSELDAVVERFVSADSIGVLSDGPRTLVVLETLARRADINRAELLFVLVEVVLQRRERRGQEGQDQGDREDPQADDFQRQVAGGSSRRWSRRSRPSSTVAAPRWPATTATRA